MSVTWRERSKAELRLVLHSVRRAGRRGITWDALIIELGFGNHKTERLVTALCFGGLVTVEGYELGMLCNRRFDPPIIASPPVRDEAEALRAAIGELHRLAKIRRAHDQRRLAR